MSVFIILILAACLFVDDVSSYRRMIRGSFATAAVTVATAATAATARGRSMSEVPT